MKIVTDRLFKKYEYDLVFSATDESKIILIDPTLGIKGEVVKMIATIPDWANTVTSTISMVNADTKEVFRSSAFTQDDEYNITLCRNECIIMGIDGEEWKVELSGAPGGSGGTVVLSAYVED
jgi:hypothetical protein